MSRYKITIRQRPQPTPQLEREVASAAGLMKELMAVANNAAWFVCLDARDELKKLPNWNQRVSGGQTVKANFKRVVNAFHAYERALIWDDEFRFFDIKDMPERTRRMYGNISNREYYDFWSAIGGTTYVRTRPLVTSLWNKYRLALVHGNIENADIVAWGMCALACLNSAVIIYDMSLDMVSETYRLPRQPLAQCFKKFSLKDIAKLWDDAARLASPKAFATPLSETDDKNIDMGIRQIMEAWTDGDKIYDDMEKTLEDCGEDVMKSQGFVRKAIAEVQQLRKWHDEDN